MNLRKWSLTLFALAVIALPLFAQDVPANSGKALFEKLCSQCHGLDVITNLKHTKPEWKAVVDTMAGYGASGTDEELDVVVNYLAQNFGPKSDAHLHASVLRVR
jgi:mono/diheme cytochrome c family protein